MQNSEIIEIVKYYFKENFENIIQKTYHNTNNALNIGGFGQQGNESEKITHVLKIDKFEIELASQETHSMISPTGIKKNMKYVILINRINPNNNYIIFSKKIIIDEKDYNELIDSIQYDDKKMLEELGELKQKIRNNKIKQITK